MADSFHIEAHRDGALIDIHAQPRSPRSEVAGAHGGALRVRITAPPVDGAANAAIVALLSQRLNVRRADVEIMGGATGRRKRVLARGLSPDDVRLRLSES